MSRPAVVASGEHAAHSISGWRTIARARRTWRPVTASYSDAMRSSSAEPIRIRRVDSCAGPVPTAWALPG